MLDLLISIVPLAIGSTLSPGILAITIALLCGKNKPLLRTLALLVGGIICVLLLTFLAFGATESGGQIFKKSPLLDLGFGGLLFVFGLKAAFEKPKKNNSDSAVKKKNRQISIIGLIVIGFLVNVTNFDAVLLYLTELKEIFHYGANGLLEFVFTIFCALMFLLPSLLPLLLYLIYPDAAKKLLDRLSVLLEQYGNKLLAILFLIFGIYFLLQGLGWTW